MQGGRPRGQHFVVSSKCKPQQRSEAERERGTAHLEGAAAAHPWAILATLGLVL